MKFNQVTIAIVTALTVVVGCSESIHDTTQTSPQQEPPLVQEELVELEVMDATNPLPATPTSKMAYSRVATDHQFMVMPMPGVDPYVQPENRDSYLETPSNATQLVTVSPLSTFSVDVDTGSYANVRSYLKMGNKPPADAIREEAFINYFDYAYPTPVTKTRPFSVSTELAPAPWNAERKLMRIALKGYDIPVNERKASNLVFLVDVSGSMNEPNKLPLLVQSLSLLAKNLGEKDKVSLVTYAGNASVVLEPTSGDNQQAIVDTLKSLQAGGGTYGESGIKLAYQQAKKGFIKDGVNRVILATDGDFNVGVTSLDALKDRVEEERENGISLTTLGFGRGNYNDAMMEQLANIGDGNHAYIDTLHEAQKVLLRQMSGTLQSIAEDVKIQVEFNPDTVKEYRLIGYQNRKLRDEDFNNDKVDAGEIGAGHTVTALYELTLVGDQGRIDDLRYQQKKTDEASHSDELAQVKVRYKLPGKDKSQLTTQVINASKSKPTFTQASADFQFATAVAAFAQKLKDNHYVDGLAYSQIADIARENRGKDPFNYRGEFISLVEIAQNL
ncbi:Von Willebrand factor type A domain protein [Grimontia indica]|uniref:von Willebrand factor type A domain protein n=1 Tax=Grimontia indica TaxID=1056512 RepID=R1IR77_9GAMM|nr:MULTISPECIES: VWA domain-containing protein [Grimontia]EOD79952.1 Von Willebrand factor type A domain protein [Grimontia indica]